MLEIQSVATRAASTKGGLTRHDFFEDVTGRLRDLLPGELAAFHHKSNMSLLKIYYANERIHYEVWLSSQHGVTEIGLHFEDGPLSTAAYLAHFDAQIVEIKHILGPTIELERWTQSWGHLFEIVPLTALNAVCVERTAGRLATMIGVLQPIVEAAGVADERSATATNVRIDRRCWRRK